MPGTPPPVNSQFAATRWSIVVAAGNWRGDSKAHRAMGELVSLYWFPLYAYLRKTGCPPTEAEDAVQGFFARVMEKDALERVDRAKGKFRSFLLASLKNYLANERDKSRAQKRGGGTIVSLDAIQAEARYSAEPVNQLTPDRVFERRWALAVLDQVLRRLREEYLQRDQGDLFAALEHLLAGEKGQSYGEIAVQLKMNEPAIKVAAHRLRKRFRELLRHEIAQTVADPSMVDEEIRELLNCL